MNPKRILFLGFALGVASIAIFQRPRISPVDDRPSMSATFAATRLSETTRSQQPTVSMPAAAPRGVNGETHATVQAILQEWFNTNTGDTATQEALTKELLALLTDENTAEIIQALSPIELSTPCGTAALHRWLETDFVAAATWLAARPDATEEHALLVARSLLEHPTELPACCDQLPEGAWKQTVLSCASLELASKNPVAALALTQQMKAGDAQTNALETIAYAWFGRDLDSAITWTKTVDDPRLRERLLAVGAKAIAAADPDLAAGWLVSSVKTAGLLNETTLMIVETWADQHPAQAAGWVTRFSEAGPRKDAINLVLGHWLKSDPAAANAWIHQLPEREILLAQLKTEQTERERAPDLL